MVYTKQKQLVKVVQERTIRINKKTEWMLVSTKFKLPIGDLKFMKFNYLIICDRKC